MLEIRKILCPTDFSDHSKEALGHAAQIAKAMDAELVVAHIIEPVTYPFAYGTPPISEINYELDLRERATAELQPIVQGLADDGIKASSLVESGTAWLRLSDLVREHDFDLIVLATHGYTGVKHVLMGSTAERVVRHCPCPVLTVKPADAD